VEVQLPHKEMQVQRVRGTQQIPVAVEVALVQQAHLELQQLVAPVDQEPPYQFQV
jgi:hypothetical protein